ncbi:MAG: hypothetical protein R3E32_19465 [Chitinophagales bacterium]
MLQRLFFLFIIINLFFTACQTGENADTSAETTETSTENEVAGSANPNIKSLKEAAKDQQQITRAKTKELQAEEKGGAKNIALQKKQALTVEGKSDSKLSEGNQIKIDNQSTKERLMQNLRQRKQELRDTNIPRPSEDFIKGTRSLYDIDLEIVKLSKKAVAGYDRIGEANIVDNYYAYVSPDNIWGGPYPIKKGEETKETVLEDVVVFEAIYKAKEMRDGAKPDIKITEIQFASKAAAEDAIPKLKALSNAIFENPKHINTFWQDDNRFYIVETRAASFEDVYDRANKVFYYTVTSSK